MVVKYNNSMYTTEVPDLEEPCCDEDPEELIFQDQVDHYFAELEDLRKIEIELIEHESKRNNPGERVCHCGKKLGRKVPDFIR